MPRMYVWLLGATTAAAATYTGYYGVYLSRIARQQAVEAQLALEQQPLRLVMQDYAQLKASVEQAKTRAAILSQQRRRNHRVIGETGPFNRDTEVAGGGGSPSSMAEADDSLGPVFHSNREKLLLYLRIQKLRWALYTLPRTVQLTEESRDDTLRTLDMYEQLYCCTGAGRVVVLSSGSRSSGGGDGGGGGAASGGDEREGGKAAAAAGEVVVATVPPLHGMLNYREAPLSVSQCIQSALCYLLYFTAFHVLPAVLSRLPLEVTRVLLSPLSSADVSALPGSSAHPGHMDPAYVSAILSYRLRLLYHRVALVIVRGLDIEVEMKVPAEQFTIPYHHRPGAEKENGVDGEAEDDGGGGKGGGGGGEGGGVVVDMLPRYVVMNPSHWIEEVGFWACRENPLLLPPSFLSTRSCLALSGFRDTSTSREGEVAGLTTVIGREASAAAELQMLRGGKDTGEEAQEDGAATKTVGAGGGRGGGEDCSAKYPALQVLSTSSVPHLAGQCALDGGLWQADPTEYHSAASVKDKVRDSVKRRGAAAAAGRHGDVADEGLGASRAWCHLFKVVECGAGHPVARAFPIDYGALWREVHWRSRHRAVQEWERLREHSEVLRGGTRRANAGDAEREGPPAPISLPSAAAAALDDGDGCMSHGRSSLGYPLAVDVSALADAERRPQVEGGSAPVDAIPRFVPVGIAGLPRLLYVGPSVAKADGKPRSSSADVYEFLAEGQYGHAPRRGDLSQSRGQRGYEADTESSGSSSGRRRRRGGGDGEGPMEEQRRWGKEEALTTAAELTALQQHGFSRLSPLWWGSVYGGRATRRRVLCYRFGSLSYAEELTREMLEVTEQAVEAAYAE